MGGGPLSALIIAKFSCVDSRWWSLEVASSESEGSFLITDGGCFSDIAAAGGRWSLGVWFWNFFSAAAEKPILVFPNKLFKSSSSWSPPFSLGYDLVVDPQTFLRTSASSSAWSSKNFLFLTPKFSPSDLTFPSSSFILSPVSSSSGVSESVCHSPAMATSFLKSSGTATPISASCANCCSLSATIACLSIPVGAAAAARRHGAPRLIPAPPPPLKAAPSKVVPGEISRFNLATSSLARCLSRSSRSWPRWSSRRKRLIFPWCLGLASWFVFSSLVSLTNVLQCLHQYFG